MTKVKNKLIDRNIKKGIHIIRDEGDHYYNIHLNTTYISILNTEKTHVALVNIETGVFWDDWTPRGDLCLEIPDFVKISKLKITNYV